MVAVQVWRSVLVAGDGDGGADCAAAVAALLRTAKEETVKCKMGVRASRASDVGDKGTLGPDTATLGWMPATRGIPHVHAAVSI